MKTSHWELSNFGYQIVLITQKNNVKYVANSVYININMNINTKKQHKTYSIMIDMDTK